jgi:hypothetical protein
MLTLYDMARVTGICTAIGSTVRFGHLCQTPTWGSGIVAAAVSVGAAWAATKATMWIARAKSETLLGLAYFGTFAIITVSGATAVLICRHLLGSL